MIEIHHETLNKIPLLHVVERGNENKQLPFVIFIHGFTSAKEHNLHFAYLLAKKGFRVVLPEAIFHGERADGRNVEAISYDFWNIVIQTLEELDIIKKHFVDRSLVNEDAIGVVGTSMGGIVTLGALTQFQWIKAAVSLMGNPNYEQFSRSQVDYLKEKDVKIPFTDEQLEESFKSLRKYDLSLQSDLLQERPLMFWHGKRDRVVPFEPTYQFYQSVKSHYQNHPERLSFIVDEYADHKVSREALLKTVDWFEKYLI